MPDQNTIEILLKFGLDDKQAKAALTEIDKIKSANKQNSNSLNDSAKFANSMAGALKTAAGYAIGFTTAAGALSAMNGAISNYVNKAGTSEAVSRDWLEVTERLDFANAKIGKTLATMVLPVYEKIADYVDKISKMKVPTTLPEAANALKGSGDIGKDLQENPIGTILSGVLKTFINPVALDALAGDTKSLEKYGIGVSQTQPELGKSIASALGIKPQEATIQQYGVEGGMIGPPAPGSESNATKWQTRAMLEQYRAFLRTEQEATRSYQVQTTRMDRDFKKQEEYTQLDFNKTRTRAIRDYNRQLQFSEVDFYRQRQIANRDFNIQMARSEADYQKSRSRANEDHEFDLYQIALSGDAMSYWLSQRQFKINEKRQQEDFDIGKKRSEEDFKKSQEDQEREFQIQRERSAAEFKIRLSDEDEDFKISRDRRQYQYDLQLKDLAFNFEEQKNLREQAFRDAYAASITTEESKAKLLAQFNTAQLTNLEDMLQKGEDYIKVHRQKVDELLGLTPAEQASATTPYTGEDDTRGRRGGDQSDGAASMARSNQMRTDMLVKSMTYNDNRRIDTAVSAEDKAALRQDAQEAMLYAMGG
jgi:hypothetical protein